MNYLKDYNITEEGTYTLTGTINNTVTVNTKGNVKLILDNVTIKSDFLTTYFTNISIIFA